jgi:cyclopropane fatty-acyl-phospholipid synthase-like methyltransferase
MQGFLDERELHALEDHMGFRGQLPEHRRFQIEELTKLGLRPAHSVLEIGCGPLTAGIPVIQYLEPGRYVGIDVRASVLNAAWQQIGRHELSEKNPQLLRSDDFGNAELAERRFDYIWAFSVLFHLSDEILDRLFWSVAKRLTKAGMFVANVQTDVESSSWLEFPFLKRTVSDYQNVAAKHGLRLTELGTIEQRGFNLGSAERTNPLLQFTLAEGD